MAISDYVAAAGTLLALLALLKGLVEYAKQGAQRRVEHLIRIGRQFYSIT